MAIEDDKQCLRQHFRAIRKELSSERRQEAAAHIASSVLHSAQQHKWVLSFNSLPEEISLDDLNTQLAKQHHLLLPRVVGHALHVFHVEQPNTQLETSKWGILEPKPNECTEIPISAITLVLVPGLAFDKEGHRLGYGKGFYDRLLDQLPISVLTLGIGFIEQLSPTPLPHSPHDRAVQQLLLG
jgi:5-formyltetrahydrofolate cyclo-ligase